jgi:S-sulfo-L-cysteine synthase (O-acetyl-L-serine-dependent)
VNWRTRAKRIQQGGRLKLEVASATGRSYGTPAVERPALGTRPLQRVGNTPLLRFDNLAAGLPHVQILGKAEWLNPGGSVKDRAALNIIESAIRSGALARGKRLLDATSGNTGIAYAMVGAARGIPVTLCVPENVSAERKRILAAYGAEIMWTDPQEGTDGAIRLARQLHQAEPQKYLYADQYSNEANWLAHYHGTAPEIWAQTAGAITHFVAGLGTSGTFVGTTRRLKELNPAIRAISVQPDSAFHGLEGLKHMPTALVPRIYDPSLADATLEITTEAAYQTVKQIARSAGVLVGISAGAALAATEKVAQQAAERNEPAVIVTVLPDSGDRYLSDNFWTD